MRGFVKFDPMHDDWTAEFRRNESLCWGYNPTRCSVGFDSCLPDCEYRRSET
jgi:hypothetical protein